MIRTGITVVLLFFCIALQAQHKSLPLHRDYTISIEKSHDEIDSVIHTGFKPILESRIALDGVLGHQVDTNKYYYWFTEKVFKTHLLEVKKEDFHLTIDPLFHFQFGLDFEDSVSRKLFHNTRAGIVKGDIGDKFSFMTTFYENQAVVPNYVAAFVRNKGVMPGQGRVKQIGKINGYDYGIASGYISYSPSDRVNIQFGHDKHFVGDGYRSLLLSDAGFNYPYLKVHTSFGKRNRFQYTNLFAGMQSLDRVPESATPEALFKRKAGSFHYLSANITKQVQVGLFEGVIWRRYRSGTGTTSVNYSAFIPVIFANTLRYQFDAIHNALVGANIKITPVKKVHLYGQVVIDDPGEGKQGFQIGAKAFDLGVDNLHAQLEYNTVAPFTYGHAAPLQNYAQYQQPLAHPIGANFDEMLAIINYEYRRFYGQLRVNAIAYGQDTTGTHIGQDIFISDNDKTGEVAPFTSTILNQDVQVGYRFNPKTNLKVFLGFTYRKLDTPWNIDKTTFMYIGLSTSLVNRYYDF